MFASTLLWLNVMKSCDISLVIGWFTSAELSQAMRRFRAAGVSVIERNDRLLHREDPDVTEALRSLFGARVLMLFLNAHIKRYRGNRASR